MAGILHVCTANVIRSPMAEMITRSLLPGFPVDSAGLKARPGQPIWPAAVEALGRRGIQARGFTASRFSPAAATRFDLVLAATRRHRDAVLTAQPLLLGRVFSWRELSFLVTGLTSSDVPGSTIAQRIDALPRIVAARRGMTAAPPGDSLDVRDPIDGPPAALARALDEIESALITLAGILTPPAGGGGAGGPRHRTVIGAG